MAGQPLGIYDSFAEQGLFWLSNHPDSKVSGTLNYDPEHGAVLNLIGIFGSIGDAFAKAFGGTGPVEQVVIHGVTMKGKPISLLNAHDTGRQINMPGIAHETWTSNLVVIGLHISNANDDKVFVKSFFRFEQIDTWLEHKFFTEKFDFEARALTVFAKNPPEMPFASHSDFEVTSVGSLYSNNNQASRFVIDVTSQLAIMPNEPQSLNWHLDRAVRLQELASLCTGRFLPLTSFELRGPDISLGGGGTMPAEVHFYARMIHGEGQGKHNSKSETPIVTGPELTRLNPHAMQLWLDEFDSFRPALHLFFTITGERQMFVNIRLLLAIQALEVFHRQTNGETVMEADAFTSFSKSMVESIPVDAEPKMREKLKSLYRFSNELSLKQRLRSIIALLTDAFEETPAGFDKRFLTSLVDTRNYYTHFSDQLTDRKLNGEGMYWATRRIILLLTLLFLQRLGIAASDIKPLLKRHSEFAQLWASAERPR